MKNATLERGFNSSTIKKESMRSGREMQSDRKDALIDSVSSILQDALKQAISNHIIVNLNDMLNKSHYQKGSAFEPNPDQIASYLETIKDSLLPELENLYKISHNEVKEDLHFISTFIDEELKGDINALESYSFEKIVNHPKYGLDGDASLESLRILNTINRVLGTFYWDIYRADFATSEGTIKYVPMMINTNSDLFKHCRVSGFEDMKRSDLSENEMDAIRKSSELNWTIGNFMCMPISEDPAHSLKCYRSIMEWDSDEFFNELYLWHVTDGKGDKERFKYFNKDLGGFPRLFERDNTLKTFAQINALEGYFDENGIAKVNYRRYLNGINIIESKVPSKSSIRERIEEYTRIHDALILDRSKALIGVLKKLFEDQN